MSTPLSSLPELPSSWLEPLAEYGYETAEEFVSQCRVEGGPEGLADVLGCPLEEVQRVDAALLLATGLDPADLEPEYHPMGALLEEE